MKDMLDRLKGADPDTYQRAFGWLKNVAWGRIKLDPEGYFLFPGQYPLRDALLQGVLQEAITSRGWQCVILSCTDHSRAAINGAERGWGMRDKISEQEGDTPAHALLAAYLEAIRV